MAFIDWLIVAAMLAASLGTGLWFARRGSGDSEDYFVAGRSLSWLLAGTSMVATTFSSDTPLFVSGMVRQEGIFANWVWWSAAPAALASTFFFAQLWRRSEAITEVELVARRYSPGRGVDVLRVLRAISDGGLQNALIMASVTLAASKILAAVLGLSPDALFTLPGFGAVTPTTLLMTVLALSAIAYTAVSGLYGVIYTDVVQFVIAMIGAVLLAAIVWWDLAEQGDPVAQIQAAAAARPETLALVPDLSRLDLHSVTFLILVTIGWWGMAPGGGHFVQRMLACRSERDAMLSMYWYTFTNYVLRSWPWIMVGLASLVYLPELTDHESAYPLMIERFLPAGLKGIMVASLMAAFMSTLTTQMNWGTSYLINDIYKPYLAAGRAPHHYVVAGRIAMLLLCLFALIVAGNLQSILGAYKYLAVMGAGNAFVLIARWYWWRVNVWTEIASLASSLVVGGLLFWLLPDRPGEDWFAVRIAANLLTTTAIAIAVTLLTGAREPSAADLAFHRQLRIGGIGWRRAELASGVAAEPWDWRSSALSWASSVALIYALLLGMGYAVLGRWSAFAGCVVVAIVSAVVLHDRLPIILAQIRQLRSATPPREPIPSAAPP